MLEPVGFFLQVIQCRSQLQVIVLTPNPRPKHHFRAALGPNVSIRLCSGQFNTVTENRNLPCYSKLLLLTFLLKWFFKVGAKPLLNSVIKGVLCCLGKIQDAQILSGTTQQYSMIVQDSVHFGYQQWQCLHLWITIKLLPPS